jgi:hypothetical protein
MNAKIMIKNERIIDVNAFRAWTTGRPHYAIHLYIDKRIETENIMNYFCFLKWTSNE